MLQPSALSYKQAAIGNTYISCRHESTSINLNEEIILAGKGLLEWENAHIFKMPTFCLKMRTFYAN